MDVDIPLLSTPEIKEFGVIGQGTSKETEKSSNTGKVGPSAFGRSGPVSSELQQTSFPFKHGPKRRKLLSQSALKQPLMLFNELFPENDLTVEMETSLPLPVFKAIVTINGKQYLEYGNSKQKAKNGVTYKVLQSMGIESVSPSSGPLLYPSAKSSPHFTHDSFEISEQASGYSFENNQSQPKFQAQRGLPKSRLPSVPGLHGGVSHIAQPFDERRQHLGPAGPRNGNFVPSGTNMSLAKQTIDKTKAGLHPTMVLIEAFPNLRMDWIVENETNQKYFVEATVLGQTFFGEARSKRLAKANLAKAILSTVYGVTEFMEPVTMKKGAKHPVSQIRESFPDASFEVNEVLLAEDENKAKEEEKEKTNEKEETQCQNDDAEESLDCSDGSSSSKKSRKFVANLNINGEVFVGEGPNKMTAKTSAARKALSIVKKAGETGKKRRRTEEEIINVDKHPSVVFNELYQGSQFKELEVLDQDKTEMFGWKVDVNDVTYTARGPSKKKAKCNLIVKILSELHDIDPSSWTQVDRVEQKDMPHSSTSAQSNIVAQLVSSASNMSVSQSFPLAPQGDKNPVSVLHELNPSLSCTFSEEPTEQNKVIFCAQIAIKGETFSGKAANKKMAKLNAAKVALAQLHGIQIEDGPNSDPSSVLDQSALVEDIPREVSDQIVELVLAKEMDVLHMDEQCRVVAGFVLGYRSFTGTYKAFEVISLGTGTKCVVGDKLSTTGTVVNDCHAEIIACRALRQYLYDQLEGIIEGKESVLEKSVTGRRRLKSDVDLFLYISTAPCGDGRVFVSSGPQLTGAMNKTAGLLRTKIENGQGTIPVADEVTQTTDGLIGGDRLLTMSCSDKIMKWNVTGVQGALLSLFVDPIYISGLIVGHSYHHGHLVRALNARCSGLTGLPNPFKIQEMKFGRPNHIDRRDTAKSSGNSCNWYKGKPVSEVIATASGKTAVGTVSSLAKIVFFKKFCELLKKSESNITPQTYHAAKKLATSYQASKTKLYAALKEKGYGCWVSKPVETDMFGF